MYPDQKSIREASEPIAFWITQMLVVGVGAWLLHPIIIPWSVGWHEIRIVLATVLMSATGHQVIHRYPKLLKITYGDGNAGGAKSSIKANGSSPPEPISPKKFLKVMMTAAILFGAAHEGITYVTDDTTTLKKMIVWGKSRENVQNLLWDDWNIKDVSYFMSYRDDDKYGLSVEFQNPVKGVEFWDLITVDRNGTILEEGVTRMMYMSRIRETVIVTSSAIHIMAPEEMRQDMRDAGLTFHEQEIPIIYDDIEEDEEEIAIKLLTQAKPEFLNGLNSINFTSERQGPVAGTYHIVDKDITVVMRSRMNDKRPVSAIQKTLCHELWHHVLNNRVDHHAIIASIDTRDSCYEVKQ